MKIPPTILLALAAVGLAIVVWRAPERAYVAPRDTDPPAHVPVRLSGDVPEGCVVRSLDVEGICCEGCGGKLFVALSAVEGVREVAVDPVLGVARAVVPSELDAARLEDALTFSKYSARLRPRP